MHDVHRSSRALHGTFRLAQQHRIAGAHLLPDHLVVEILHLHLPRLHNAVQDALMLSSEEPGEQGEQGRTRATRETARTASRHCRRRLRTCASTLKISPSYQRAFPSHHTAIRFPMFFRCAMTGNGFSLHTSQPHHTPPHRVCVFVDPQCVNNRCKQAIVTIPPPNGAILSPTTATNTATTLPHQCVCVAVVSTQPPGMMINLPSLSHVQTGDRGSRGRFGWRRRAGGTQTNGGIVLL